MNREFFLSLGITILTCVTMFLYFRHRFKVVEHKVNTIFQLVQSHAQPIQQLPTPSQDEIPMMHPSQLHSQMNLHPPL